MVWICGMGAQKYDYNWPKITRLRSTDGLTWKEVAKEVGIPLRTLQRAVERRRAVIGDLSRDCPQSRQDLYAAGMWALTRAMEQDDTSTVARLVPSLAKLTGANAPDRVQGMLSLSAAEDLEIVFD